MPRAHVHRLPVAAPDDTAAIARGIAAGTIRPENIVAVLFVSGGAQHQGPDGGAPCAIIVERI